MKKKMLRMDEEKKPQFIETHVKDLMKKKFKEDQMSFTIRLVVLKQIMFRRGDEGKSRIQFIGGDHSGIVVCETDYYEFISEGK